jgi:hypothetical protein
MTESSRSSGSTAVLLTFFGQAIAFYRSVRAMRYEDECRVLLAAAG